MIKKGNKVVAVTLTKYHVRKLAIMRDRTGLSVTGIIRRLIEQHDVFGIELEGEEESS